MAGVGTCLLGWRQAGKSSRSLPPQRSGRAAKAGFRTNRVYERLPVSSSAAVWVAGRAELESVRM